MPKNSFGVQKDEQGVVLQKHSNSLWTPSQLKQHLGKPSMLTEQKRKFDLVMTEQEEQLGGAGPGKEFLAMKCKSCSTLISVTQPYVTATQHIKHCNGPPEEAEELDCTEDRPGKRARKQNNHSITAFMPSAQLQDKVHRDLLRSLITGNIPFRFMNNEYLVRAFAAVGVHVNDSIGWLLQNATCSDNFERL